MYLPMYIQGGQAHYVSQFQVLGWSSDGKASSPVEIVNCMLNVENARRRCGDTPVIVHCRLVSLSNQQANMSKTYMYIHVYMAI